MNKVTIGDVAGRLADPATPSITPVKAPTLGHLRVGDSLRSFALARNGH